MEKNIEEKITEISKIQQTINKENRKNAVIDSASFRDPSGYVLHFNNEIYRVIKDNYKDEYNHLIESGLYDKLVSDNLILKHWDTQPPTSTMFNFKEYYKIIKQEKVRFISYPYEWSFDMLKDASLVTLRIQNISMEFGMSLKDASAYNIQFQNGKPVLIDVTSFDMYANGPWKAYRQFCEHFLAPLALMAKKDIRISQLFMSNIDGIPLDIAAEIIPKSTFANFGLAAHIHAHARAQKHYEDKKIKKQKLGKMQLLGIIASLKSTILGLKIKQKTEWADYYRDTNYSESAFENKQTIVKEMLDKISSDMVIDLGANDGTISKIASENSFVISMDIDPIAVNTNYLNSNGRINPIVANLANPSPAIGWANCERISLIDRLGKNTCLALALIHHLRITYGIPLKKQFDVFSKISKHLIIEFIPKDDSQVTRLLQNRPDIYDDYTSDMFEEIAQQDFTIIDSKPVGNSLRKIYLMNSK